MDEKLNIYCVITDYLAGLSPRSLGDVFEQTVSILDKKNRFTKTSREEDIYLHQDLKNGKDTIDVKAVKKYRRNDKEFAEKVFLLEYRHVGVTESGEEKRRPGWLFGSSKYLAIGYARDYDFYVLFFERDKLANWVEKKLADGGLNITIRDKGQQEKPSVFGGVTCTWKYDEILWVFDDPKTIDGYLGERRVTKILYDMALKNR